MHSESIGSIQDGMSREEAWARLMQLPENEVGEIIAGELIVSPRPASPHALATSTLAMELGSPFQRGRGGPGGWWILVEPELHLGEDVLIPDLAGWRVERMPVMPDVAAFTLAPDWVCEVVSPSTGALDRIRKMPLYAKAGVRDAWLVDPLARFLESFRLQDGHWLRLGAWGEDERPRVEPFSAIELELRALWLPGNAPSPVAG